MTIFRGHPATGRFLATDLQLVLATIHKTMMKKNKTVANVNSCLSQLDEESQFEFPHRSNKEGGC